MKNVFKKSVCIFLLSMAYISVNAQRIYVNVRPARPVVVVKRPVAPSPAHIWVEEEWIPQGRTYVWHGGYWAAPPRPRAIYVPGHWARTKRGNIWIVGCWR